MSVAIAAVAEAGDPDSNPADSFAAIVAEVAGAAFIAGESDLAVIAAAKACHLDTDTPDSIAAFTAQTSGITQLEPFIAVSSATKVSDPHPDSADSIAAIVTEAAVVARMSIECRRRSMMTAKGICGPNNRMHVRPARTTPMQAVKQL